MTYVWFVGHHDARKISAANWTTLLGDNDYADSEWNATNGWSLPSTDFDEDQLTYLASDSEFLTAQATTPRTAPAPPTQAAAVLSNYQYYYATKALYDQINLNHVAAKVTRKVVTVTPGATPAINTDSGDTFSIVGLGVAITSLTSGLTGTPAHGDSLLLEFTDDGTGRAISHGAKFEASTVTLATTTVTGALLQELFFWNAVTSKWRLFAKA